MARQRRAPAASEGPAAPRGRTPRLVLPALLLLALAVRLVAVAQLHAHPLLQPDGGLDADSYASLGRRIAAGDLSLRGLGSEPFVVAPLYAYFLGLVFALSGGSLLAARLVQALLGAAAVWVAARVTRSWGGQLAATTAAALLAACGFVVFSEVLISQSALDPVLTALALWAWSVALTGDRPLGYAWSGAAFGLLALNRPNALAVGLALAALLAVARRGRGGALRAAGMAAGLALAVSPALLRNLAVSGQPVAISAHGGLNFYIGNHAQADGRFRSVPGVRPNVAGQAEDARRVASAAAGQALTTRQASDWFYAQAFGWIRAHPAQALELLLRKLGYLLHGADLALEHSYDYYARDEPTLLAWLAVGPGLVVAAGLLGLALRLGLPPRAPFVLWAAFVPLMALAVAAFFVSARYRLPLLVPLAVGAGFLAEWVVEAARLRRQAALAGAGLAFVALILIVQRPLGVDTGRDAERAARLEAWIASGQADLARARLPAWEATARDPARLLLRAGRALGARGDFGEAAGVLGRAAARAPGSGEVQLALGVARRRAGDEGGAASALRAALELHEQPAVAAFELAQAQAATGDRNGARATLEQFAGMSGLEPDGLRALGLLALEAQDAELATTFFVRLTRLVPDDAGALRELALAQGLAGRRTAAIDSARRALALRPDDLPTRRLLELLERPR